jgi:hypothetical protein
LTASLSSKLLGTLPPVDTGGILFRGSAGVPKSFFTQTRGQVILRRKVAIAEQIVEMHGGRIWVASTLGKGSTFQMELPTHAEP